MISWNFDTLILFPYRDVESLRTIYKTFCQESCLNTYEEFKNLFSNCPRNIYEPIIIHLREKLVPIYKTRSFISGYLPIVSFFFNTKVLQHNIAPSNRFRTLNQLFEFIFPIALLSIYPDFPLCFLIWTYVDGLNYCIFCGKLRTNQKSAWRKTIGNLEIPVKRYVCESCEEYEINRWIKMML